MTVVTGLLTLAVVIVALMFAITSFRRLRGSEMRYATSQDEMFLFAQRVRKGSEAFLKTEYKVIVPAVVVIAALFTSFIEVGSGFFFLLGSVMSSFACIFGMRAAVYANVLTTRSAARHRSVSKAVRKALLGGSVSGLLVQALGLLGFMLTVLIGGFKVDATGHGIFVDWLCNPTVMHLTAYSLGCSLVAMFNRVAGGNFTKAADIAADMVGKVNYSLAEDDARNPSVLADFVGDNVNDIAGNCSDLLESFVAALCSCELLAMAIVRSHLGMLAADELSALLRPLACYPVLVAMVGLLGSVLGIRYVLGAKDNSDNPSKHLNVATYIAAGVTMLGSILAAFVLFRSFGVDNVAGFKWGWFSPFIATVLGLVSGVAIGKLTEYYTSGQYKPVKLLAEMAKEGAAFVVTKGDAIGSRSCLLPVVVIVMSLLAAGFLCGGYGIAISALGMLSFVATTVSVDAFGPISDNAGGIAEACQLDPEIRVITDKLDEAGNTTAAIGKGFAIGSAAFATVSLILSYVESYSIGVEPILNVVEFSVFGGILFGAALVEFFSSKLTDNTVEAAKEMAEESKRQLANPDILSGKIPPDYETCIKLATNFALKRMLLPSMMAMLMPLFCAIMFGVQFVGGMLIGATVTAVIRALFMGNSGGAFDNAKKYIEAGNMGEGFGKNSEAHKAAVAGDTVGDTRKDVVGVALDIFIKMMSTVANIIAPLL